MGQHGSSWIYKSDENLRLVSLGWKKIFRKVADETWKRDWKEEANLRENGK